MTNLEYLRRARGLTQEKLGAELGYKSGVMICLIEKHKPPRGMISKRLVSELEEFFGESIERLLEAVKIKEV